MIWKLVKFDQQKNLWPKPKGDILDNGAQTEGWMEDFAVVDRGIHLSKKAPKAVQFGLRATMYFKYGIVRLSSIFQYPLKPLDIQ